jgi:hypothetical protein
LALLIASSVGWVSVKINDEVLERLRNHIALTYKGKIWGKISSEIEIAGN